jgi:Leucine-rich repeat (LRR) protein
MLRGAAKYILILIFFFFSVQVKAQVIVQDSLVLIDLYNSTSGPDWLISWDTSKEITEWVGVILTGDNSQVAGINLPNNQLIGQLPSSLSNLQKLASLDLSGNQIDGKIPLELGNLDELVILNLSKNRLSDEIPAEIGLLDDLKSLDFSENSLQGEIPNQLGDIDSLRILDLSNNQLSGGIPSNLGNLDSINSLNLSDNLLDLIPSSLTNLQIIRTLDLSNNQFSGPLPSFQGISDELQILDLHGNNFVGKIPSEFGDMANLKDLDLSENELTDTLPATFSNLLFLENLDLSDNALITLVDISNLGTAGNLQQFNVSNNLLGFEDLEFNFILFGDSTDYSPQGRINDTLNVAVPTGNSYTLSVDAGGTSNEYRWFLESEDSLIQMDFQAANFEFIISNFQEENSGSYSCQIVSTVVPGLTLLRNPINLFQAISTLDSLALIDFNQAAEGENWIIKWNVETEPVFTWEGVEIESGGVIGIELEDNNLGGYLSESIGLLENLQILDLSGNDIQDSLPSSIGNLKKLTILDLANNDLEGTIPSIISDLDSLQIVDFSRNNFTGSITDQFDSLQLLVELNLSDNDLFGEISSSLLSLPLIEILTIGDNGLTGEIPSELGNLVTLLVLDLSENKLSGIIPEEISTLPKLEELKLFRNQLVGELPMGFTNSLTIDRLFINDNLLTSIPKFSTNQFNNLELRVFNNILTFDDLVDNFNGFNNAGREDEFLFLPQPTIIDQGSQTLLKDESATLEIPDDHIDSEYRWLKEGIPLGVDNQILSIDSVDVSSSGIYLGQVWTTNSNFTDEINTESDSLVFTFTYTILVSPATPDIDDPEPFCIGSESVTLINDFDGQTGLVSRWYDSHPSSGAQPFSEDPIIIHQIVKASDTLYVSNGLAINKTFESEVDTVVIISRPWIVDNGDFLEAAPSDSLLNIRFMSPDISSNYQWFSNDILIEGATSNTFLKSSDQSYHVRIIREGCSSTSNEYNLPEENLVTGISKEPVNIISAYPNPVNDELIIEGLTNLKGSLDLSVMDLRGMVIINETINKGSPNNFQINVHGLIPGVYLLRISSNNKQVIKRFVKQ